jgi:hypothetical protein
MSRFAVASKALRGPFRKLVRTLELTLRKPTIKKLGPLGRKVSRHFRAKDEATALRAAREEAALRVAQGGKIWPATSAAVDRRTGRVVGVGQCAEALDVPSELMARLPENSIEPWSVFNCGEVAAASRAIDAGSKLEDLVIRTVRTRSGTEFPSCGNCKTWLPGGD